MGHNAWLKAAPADHVAPYLRSPKHNRRFFRAKRLWIYFVRMAACRWFWGQIEAPVNLYTIVHKHIACRAGGK